MTSRSQPLAVTASQSRKPLSHRQIVQAPPHPRSACASGGHIPSQPPQWSGSTSTFVSHPLFRFASQSAKPTWQMSTAHRRSVSHRTVALSVTQASQPSAAQPWPGSSTETHWPPHGLKPSLHSTTRGGAGDEAARGRGGRAGGGGG